MRFLTQRELDEWLPTLVRYLGALLTIVLVIASVLGHNDYPSGYIAAAGMLLYKTVAGSRNDYSDDDDERWSHLP